MCGSARYILKTKLLKFSRGGTIHYNQWRSGYKKIEGLEIGLLIVANEKIT